MTHPRLCSWVPAGGALSETHDFLERLSKTDEQFPSPTDFIGSVHNAAAGQIAMQFKATGANLTMTGGDYSFEQALMTAELMSGDCREGTLVVGADENHPELSPLFDPSVAETASLPADGGGALYLKRGVQTDASMVRTLVYKRCRKETDVRSAFEHVLEKRTPFNDRYGIILAGLPAVCRKKANAQLESLLAMSGFSGAVVDYRRFTGEFASASAVAVVMAVNILQKGRIPRSLCNGKDVPLGSRGVLVVGMGDYVTAIEVMHP